MAGGARRPIVAGNWKMNGTTASTAELAKIVDGARALTAVDVMVCPPATLLAGFAAAVAGEPVQIGGQDCRAGRGLHRRSVGRNAQGCRRHRRHRRADVRAKALAARRAGLCAIVCVGETRAQREDGQALAVVEAQLDGSVPDGASAERVVVAYEPVWAIGSGLTPTPTDIAEMHGFIRRRLVSRFGAEGQGIRILYGGSVKPSNAKELLGVANVDGALVGGASLKADEFLAIAGVYR